MNWQKLKSLILSIGLLLTLTIPAARAQEPPAYPTPPRPEMEEFLPSELRNRPTRIPSTHTAPATNSITPAAFCDTVTEIPPAECEALVTFYNSTNGAGWWNNDGWLVTTTPCSWMGVACDAGRVVGLELYDNDLSGSIPEELGNLSHLEILDLGFAYPDAYRNGLRGSIPATLGNLTNLEILSLLDNQLSGGIPEELGNLTHLRYLSLGRNHLQGNIPAVLGNLAYLEHLHLSYNQLSGSIPAELGNLAHLRYLYLYNNDLSGSIPAELGNLAHLEVLYLNNNLLNGALPQSLTNLQLEWFWFHNTDLCEPGDAAFQNWLARIPFLLRTEIICPAQVPTAAPVVADDEPSEVPEASTLLLLGSGVAPLVGYVWRRYGRGRNKW